MRKQWPFLFTRLLLVSMAAGVLIVADNATTLAAVPSLSITVSPSTTVAHSEEVILTAEVSDPSQVASYRWAHVGGSQDLSTSQQVADGGTKVTIGAAGRWPHSPGTRTFQAIVTLNDGSQVTAEQSITFTNPSPPPPDVSVSISVSPGTSVAHSEEVTLTAQVSDPAQVASYRWAHVGGSQDLSIPQQVTDRGTKVTIGAAGRWPHSPGTRTFQAIVTLNDGSQVTAQQSITFTNPSPPPPPPDVSVCISVSPGTSVPHSEEVTLTAQVSDPTQVASYRWAHVGGSQDLSTSQQVTDGGTKVTIGAVGRWPHGPGTRTFQAIVTLNDGSQVAATQAISFINPPPVWGLASLPAPVPAFTPNPDADCTPGWPVSHSYTGDHVQTLDPGIQTETHVSFDNGTLTPPAGKRGINIFNTSPSDAHAITVGSNAEINVTKAFATSIITHNNEGDVRIVNRGTINLPETGRGLHAAMWNAPGNVRLVNYGTIHLDGPTAEPEEVWTTKPHLLNAHMLRAGAPHDFVDYSHSAELINMPDASLIATGTYNGITSKWPAKMRNNGSMGGLKTEAGGGHLGRVINHGKIEIEATAGRGLWAYGLWGAAQAHNFGTVTMSGLFSQGIRVVNCAPYPFDENGCHQALNEIIPDPDGTPGDVYARNYPTGVVTTLPSTREGDTRTHRKAYGILAHSKTAGRVFAINEGTISTAGKNSHGIYARGYGNARDQNANYPHIPDYPDTSDHDAIYAANTGAITTDGEAAHGIDAKHARGGPITVLNLKTTTTTGTQSQGTITTEGDNSAGIFVHAPAGAVPVSTCNTADSNSPDASCERVVVVSSVEIVNTGDITADGSGGSGIEVNSDGGEVDVDNSGDITADGSDGIGIGVINDGGEVNVDNSGDIVADDIGIDVISDGGDITVVHTGDITASQVGIRVQTSGQGRIRIEITGELNAPTPYEVIGGVDNEIIEETD